MSTGPAGAVVPPPGRAAIARRLRGELGPPPQRGEWPPVSIVVVNRDGEGHLRLLLPRLAEATDYPRLELILVDNGSRDGSVEYARAQRLPFPLTVVENPDNLSFSDANDDGAERAAFDLLLFLNNDVEPFEPGWLKELVACLEGTDAAAAGATLMRGERRGGGYVVQHRRVELAGEVGFVRVSNAGDGDALGPPAADVPALASTAACLLIRREPFERVGGFTTGYLWGWEDVDLGLKLMSGGDRVVCSRRSFLFHHESSSRSARSHEWQRTTRAHNRRLFAQRWGPQVRREYLLDRMGEGGFWTDGRPPLLAVALSGRAELDAAAGELADAVEEQGWRVTLVAPHEDEPSDVPEDSDFVLLTQPSAGASLHPGLVCVPWIHDGVEAWADAPLLRRAELTLIAHLDTSPDLEAGGIAPVLFGGADDAGRLIGLLRERTQRLRFCLKLSRDRTLDPVATALRRSLDARGHACTVQLADEWELLGGATADVALVFGDAGEYETKPAQLNVLWAPEPPRPTECDRWDLVLIADESAAASLQPETPTLVAPLDLGSTGDAAEPLLSLVAQAAARDGVPSHVAAR